MPSPSHPASANGAPAPRRLLVILTSLLVAAASLLIAAPAALAVPPTTEVFDTVDVLDAEELASDLATVNFRDEVALKILTVDVTAWGQDPASDLALNDAVLAYARSEQPGWIDGDVWADGIVVLAIDPDNRFLGTYAGDDTALGESGFEDVQDAMREEAGHSDWQGAMVSGAEKYAALLGRPFWANPMVIFVEVIVGLAGLIWAVGALTTGSSRRRAVDRALAQHSEAEQRAGGIRESARRIPTDRAYGRFTHQDAERWLQDLQAAESRRAELPAHRGRLWGITGSSAAAAKDYTEIVDRLESGAAPLLATADLLLGTGAWQDAWAEERRPLESSLEGVDDLLARLAADGDPTGPSAEALRASADEIAAQLAGVDEAFRRGDLAAEDALAALDRLTGDLARASSAVRREAVRRDATDDVEAGVMQEAMPEGFVRDFPGSVRARRAIREPDAYLDYGEDWSISPVLRTISWYGIASQALATHRNPPSTSTSSSSGYSSGSGGFSGAGSSSRF
ncbi:DUF5129 domain-containing protein [Brachybacterium sp. DNPG3]